MLLAFSALELNTMWPCTCSPNLYQGPILGLLIMMLPEWGSNSLILFKLNFGLQMTDFDFIAFWFENGI